MEILAAMYDYKEKLIKWLIQETNKDNIKWVESTEWFAVNLNNKEYHVRNHPYYPNFLINLEQIDYSRPLFKAIIKYFERKRFELQQNLAKQSLEDNNVSLIKQTESESPSAKSVLIILGIFWLTYLTFSFPLAVLVAITILSALYFYIRNNY